MAKQEETKHLFEDPAGFFQQMAEHFGENHPLMNMATQDPMRAAQIATTYYGMKAKEMAQEAPEAIASIPGKVADTAKWAWENPSEAAGKAVEMAAEWSPNLGAQVLWGPGGVLNPSPAYASGGPVVDHALALVRAFADGGDVEPDESAVVVAPESPIMGGTMSSPGSSALRNPMPLSALEPTPGNTSADTTPRRIMGDGSTPFNEDPGGRTTSLMQLHGTPLPAEWRTYTPDDISSSRFSEKDYNTYRGHADGGRAARAMGGTVANADSPVVDRALALTRALPPSRHMPRSTGTPVVKPLARKTP
jgi:hypothetical protein